MTERAKFTNLAVSPTCPWCGDEVTDSPLEDISHDGLAHMMDCASCDKPVLVRAEIRIRYQAAKDLIKARIADAMGTTGGHDGE